MAHTRTHTRTHWHWNEQTFNTDIYTRGFLLSQMAAKAPGYGNNDDDDDNGNEYWLTQQSLTTLHIACRCWRAFSLNAQAFMFCVLCLICSFCLRAQFDHTIYILFVVAFVAYLWFHLEIFFGLAFWKFETQILSGTCVSIPLTLHPYLRIQFIHSHIKLLFTIKLLDTIISMYKPFHRERVLRIYIELYII